MKAALQVHRVSKAFNAFYAVNDLSFSVEPGEIFGFLGGNGAGKTTTLRMVLDIIRPSSGSISVLGNPPGQVQSARVGFLPEERGLYARMSVIDTIAYFGRLKGMSRIAAHTRGLELLKRFDLADRASSHIGELSKGMAQKVQLATTLVNSPDLLIMDEPFSGLDPVNQGLLEEEILRASGDGAAVIFSTHVMQHAERLCSRLLLLSKGEKRFEGTLQQAREVLPARINAVAGDAIGSVEGIATASVKSSLGEGWKEWELQLQPEYSTDRVLEHCTRLQIPLRRFEEQRPSLHDVFVRIVGEEGERP